MFILNQGSVLNNSNLLPETTIDYEIGFKQALNKRSALTISAFYRELRDMVQITSVNYAHPTTYNTYANIDFGTVKGFSFVYDLRRTGNVQLTANYTLQFADGSGSGSESGLSLINSGQPNLRTILPLDFDQRHAITTTIDYRYGNKDNYDGPVLGGKKILADAGANFQVRMGSGTPYSKQSNVTQEAAFGISQRSTLSGNINGARLPFQFRVDARFDKSFNFQYGSTKKKANCTVYLQVQNLLDTRNIASVYRFTGNAEDDGYLSSAVAQTAINQQTDPQSYKDQYSIKVNRPNNYTLPRRIRLGVNINF
jgi:outer membrane receptor protein involved in Fe transport